MKETVSYPFRRPDGLLRTVYTYYCRYVPTYIPTVGCVQDSVGAPRGRRSAVMMRWQEPGSFFFPSTEYRVRTCYRYGTSRDLCHLLRWAHPFHNNSLLLKRPCHLVRAVVGPHATVLPKTRRSSLLVLARPPMFNVSPMISEVRCQPRRCKQ